MFIIGLGNSSLKKSIPTQGPLVNFFWSFLVSRMNFHKLRKRK